MKNTKRVLAATLAVCALFVAGCGNNKQDGGNNQKDEDIYVSKGTPYSVYSYGDYKDGIHEINYTETSDVLVKNNTSEYAILIPADASKEIIYAADELHGLFKEATTVDLEIVGDDDESVGEYSENKKYISLGNTTYAKNAGVETTKELTNYGYVIKTVGKNVYIKANTDVGVTFGVYEFLEIYFNFDCFTNDCYTIDRQSDAKLFNFDVRDVPDIKGNEQQNGLYQIDDGLRRLRHVSRGEIRIDIGAGKTNFHSTLTVLSPSTYYPEHPKWFYNAEKDADAEAQRGQLCYTAHGDAEEYEAMAQTLTDKCIEGLKLSNSSLERIIAFMQMDNQTWCNCAACTEVNRQYGTDCAVQIKFINDVVKRIDDWMKSEEGEQYAKDYTIMYFAYYKTVNAPVKKVNGEWVPIDETVIPAEHTMVYLAPIEYDAQCDIDSECNVTSMENFERWKALIKNSKAEIGMWTYYRNYNDHYLPFDSFTVIQNWYKYIATLNVCAHYEEGELNKSGKTPNWSALRSYLSSKLGWNVNLSAEELTKKFFKYYYGDASDDMYELFLETRAVASKNREAVGGSKAIFNDLDKQEYWPEQLALDGLATIDKALKSVEYLKKTDPTKYQLYSTNIEIEKFTYAYMLIEYYSDHYDSDYIYELKMQLKRIAEANTISQVGGAGTVVAISDLWDEWGI